MIWLYSGTPGSGKSLHAASDIQRRLKRGGGLICNFPINEDIIKTSKARFVYVDNSQLTVELLKEYARHFHKIGVEGQTLLVVDECQILYNSRDWNIKTRMKWVEFFSQHRKYGYNVILIAQNDRMLDRQIRSLIEYEVKHRKLTNYGFIGKLISLFLFNRPFFIAIETWYGGNRVVLSKEMFRYRKKLGELYNSYALFDTGLGDKGDKKPPQAARPSGPVSAGSEAGQPQTANAGTDGGPSVSAPAGTGNAPPAEAARPSARTCGGAPPGGTREAGTVGKPLLKGGSLLKRLRRRRKELPPKTAEAGTDVQPPEAAEAGTESQPAGGGTLLDTIETIDRAQNA